MPEESFDKISKWRQVFPQKNVIAFWFLGLANNYGYVVMLSAAHDILADFGEDNHNSTDHHYQRDCNTMSTGVILLADIMPAILVKIISPFVPLYIHIRMALVIVFAITGFLLVAVKIHKGIVLLGVVFTSLSCGLGESSLLSYMVFFKTTSVISTWSSGTGGAGIVGSTSYAALIALGLSPVSTLLVMMIVPILEVFIFYFMIEHPKTDIKFDDAHTPIPTEADVLTFQQKLGIIPNLVITYMAPFGLVFLFEYFINQGLFELLYFPTSYLTQAEQYRWYSVLYQIGVFASRSSMNLFEINNIWLLALLQCINVIICLLEVFYGFAKFLPVLFIIIFWEGLVGGASYVNTYRKIATETSIKTRQFCMAMNTFADAIMISSAGFFAYPIHNIICTIPSPYKIN